MDEIYLCIEFTKIEIDSIPWKMINYYKTSRKIEEGQIQDLAITLQVTSSIFINAHPFYTRSQVNISVSNYPFLSLLITPKSADQLLFVSFSQLIMFCQVYCLATCGILNHNIVFLKTKQHNHYTPSDE
jgi:hypothetical protein